MAMTLKPKPRHTNGKRFVTIHEIKEKSKHELLALQKSASRIVSGIGNHASISVLYFSEFTLKSPWSSR